jgi:pyruvate-ferredoxin/flavodoxin oxidoreductase
MAKGMEQQKLAAESGYWPLYRYDPRLRAEGKNPFQLDSKPPRISFQEYALHENRYRMLKQINPKEADHLFKLAQESIWSRWKEYAQMAEAHTATTQGGAGQAASPAELREEL